MTRLHRAVRPLVASEGPVAAQPKRAEFGVVKRQHLAYHLYPVRTAMTAYHVHRLLDHIGRFDRVRIAVATDARTYTHEDVREMFGPEGRRVEWLDIANNDMRDAAAFYDLLEPLVSHDPDTAILWSHGKGCSRHSEPMEWVWAESMYRRLWDDPCAVDSLRSYPCVGACLWDRPVRFVDGSSTRWHFAGSFYWMRAAELASRNWRPKPVGNWHAEAYPGRVFALSEVCGMGEAWQDRPRNVTSHYPLPEPYGLRIDIGGGTKPRRGHINVDRCDDADVRVNLEDGRLPFADDSVSAIYTSHCLEHVDGLVGLLREMVRVCRLGASIEIRVPHYLSAMAMCHDHKQVIPLEQIKHWTDAAVAYWLGDATKRLVLVGHHDVASNWIDLGRKAFPHLTDAEIMRVCPNAAHESVFQLLVWQP